MFLAELLREAPNEDFERGLFYLGGDNAEGGGVKLRDWALWFHCTEFLIVFRPPNSEVDTLTIAKESDAI